jgi:hypothetical protein
MNCAGSEVSIVARIRRYNYHVTKLYKTYPEARKAGSFHNWLKMGGTGSARKSMRSFVLDQEGDSIVDFIGMYENLQGDWKQAFKKIGMLTPELPHLDQTRTSHAPVYSAIDKDVLQLVRSEPMWNDDIEYFGYAEYVVRKFKEAQAANG